MRSSKVIKSVVKDDGISSMFNQMTGTGELNIKICYAKYDNIRMYITKMLEIIEIFHSSYLLKSFNELIADTIAIKTFIQKIKNELKEIFNITLSEEAIIMIEDKQYENFTNKYEKMKCSNVVNIFIGMCDKLIQYRKYLMDNELSHKFILNMAGTEWTPLIDFSPINIKYIVDKLEVDKKEKEIKFILIFLNKLLVLSHKLYKEYSKSDFDLDEFSESLMQNIESVKKHIPRCDKAFNRIKNSIGLLKNNFGEYYKDFVQTQSKTIIMENFICDVANDTKKVDPELTRQFRTIIQFYKKHANEQKFSSNPKIKNLFDKINSNFIELDSYKNLSEVKDLEVEEPKKDEQKEKEQEQEQKEKEEQHNNEIKKKEEEYMKKSVDDIMNEFDL